MKNNIVIIIFASLTLALFGLLFFYFYNVPEFTTDDPRLEKILSSGQLNIGLSIFYPPIVFVENEELKGLDPDIAREIASDLGVEANFKIYLWEDLFEALLNDEVDIIISAITITPERSEIMSFSTPYFNAGQVIVANAGSGISGVQDLMGKRVGVQKETTSEIEAFKYTEDELVISFESYELTRIALLNRDIDAIIIDYPAGVDMAYKYDLELIGSPFTQEFYGVAARRGERALLDIVNSTIRRIKRESIMKQIENRWLII